MISSEVRDTLTITPVWIGIGAGLIMEAREVVGIERGAQPPSRAKWGMRGQ